jgi:hypothetical protein
MKILSSPACRCLQTALLAGEHFGNELFGDSVSTPPGMDRVEVHESLLSGRGVGGVTEIATATGADLVLISLHADLAMLPLVHVEDPLFVDKDGFFDAHPVIAVIEQRDNRLELAELEGLYEGRWQSLKRV